MDPNEALKNAREASRKVAEASTQSEMASAAVDLMMYFDALDQSMTGGMFTPDDWERKRKSEPMDNKLPDRYVGRRTVSPRGF